MTKYREYSGPEAREVVTWKSHGLRFVWRGSYAVTVHDGRGEVDFFTVGGFPPDKVTEAQVADGIATYLEHDS